MENKLLDGSANPLKIYTTAELVNELKTRDGVSYDILAPEDKIRVITGYDFNGQPDSYEEEHTGPMIIFYVID